jgi:hypothetical protein
MTTYPLTLPNEGDARFTGELIDDVAAVLVAHGFPPLFDDDTVFGALRGALAGFLYGPAFKPGDRVSWYDGYTNMVRTGTVRSVANTGNGPIAQISAYSTPITCSKLTLIPEGGAS